MSIAQENNLEWETDMFRLGSTHFWTRNAVSVFFFTLGVLGLTLFPVKADAADITDCIKAFEGKIYDVYQVRQSVSRRTAIRNILDSDTLQEQWEKKHSKGGGEVNVIEIVKVGGSGQSSSESFSQFKERLRSDLTEATSEQDYMEILVEVANPEIQKTIRECIKAVTGDGDIRSASWYADESRKCLAYAVRFTPITSTVENPACRISSIQTTPSLSVPTLIEKNGQIPTSGIVEILFRQDTSQSDSLYINTNWGAVQLDWDAVSTSVDDHLPPKLLVKSKENFAYHTSPGLIGFRYSGTVLNVGEKLDPGIIVCAIAVEGGTREVTSTLVGPDWSFVFEIAYDHAKNPSPNNVGRQIANDATSRLVLYHQDAKPSNGKITESLVLSKVKIPGAGANIGLSQK